MAHVHLKSTLKGAERGFKRSVGFAFLLPLFTIIGFDRMSPSEKVISILAWPLMLAATCATFAFAVCRVLAQLIVFPFQCLIALIRDGMAGGPTPPGGAAGAYASCNVEMQPLAPPYQYAGHSDLARTASNERNSTLAGRSVSGYSASAGYLARNTQPDLRIPSVSVSLP